jgi:hypothetical protein
VSETYFRIQTNQGVVCDFVEIAVGPGLCFDEDPGGWSDLLNRLPVERLRPEGETDARKVSTNGAMRNVFMPAS